MDHLDINWGSRKRARCEVTKTDDSDESFIRKFRAYVNGKASCTKITGSKNRVYFYSAVNQDSIHTLIEELKKAEDRCLTVAKDYSVEAPPIYLHIHSYGGSVFSALAAVDAIRGCSVPVYSVIEGCAASAGTLISIVAKKRFITKNSKMLIHQLSSGFWGKMDDIEEELTNLRSLMRTLKGLYSEYTKVPGEKLDEILKHDLWWDAEQCLQYALVDEVL